MSETLKITVEGRMARVTLNRPEGRKAFNDGLIAELRAACEQLGPREDLRARTARRIADIRVSGEGKAGVQSFLKQTPAHWL
jgi:1,4-dihydroxy-2-naphthoyl-CoA synthase